MAAARVYAYSHHKLCELLAERAGNTVESIERKLHAVYFEEYFTTLAAKTIVVEDGYVDHDFLEDFASYYVRCFETYSRHCVRLHFFREAFTSERFADAFSGDRELYGLLQRSYLGFIVVRPIPQRVVGRTCLATYPEEGEREFPITRSYEANLFGLRLSVASLAFQEQDRAVAACATSALWSVFQGTGYLFHHRIPSPAEITRRATATNPLDGRAFPAGDGLMFVQMADAVRSCELEPLWLSYTEGFFIRAVIRAYLSARIPLLLNGDIHERDDAEFARPLGTHAVAITGYRNASAALAEPDGFSLSSSRISKLYCHDDGVGPFARMEFEDGGVDGPVTLSTSQAPSNTEIGTRIFKPGAILVPLYHKIRVPFLRVYAEVRAFDNYLTALRTQLDEVQAPTSAEFGALSPLEWDIRLSTVNDYKTDCLHRAGVESRRAVLETGLPRYLWLARAVHADGNGFDILFDATGLELSNLCLGFTHSGSRVLLLLREMAAAGTQLAFPGCEGILQTLTRT